MVIESWASEYRIEVNKSKSAIIQVRVDKRTPGYNLGDFHSIKYSTSYRYLGVRISDDLNIEENLDGMAQHERNLNRIKWIIEQENRQLDGAPKYHLFQGLFRSKVSYAINLMTSMDKQSLKWLEGYWYRSLKLLTGFKYHEKINKDRLFQICLG